MTENPYVAPTASLVEPVVVPAQVRTDIKNAWVAAVISGTLTLAVTLFAIWGSALPGINAWNLVDVALIYGLAFGISRCSRLCAIGMLVYFIASKIIMWMDSGKASGMLLSLIFIYYFIKGSVATFAYHKAIKAAA